MSTFKFSSKLQTQLKENGGYWDNLLFRACMEAKEKEVKASVFADALRKTGFRCGTGPARAAYKAVRDGGDQKGMITAVTAVKAKRKADKGTTATTATTATPDTLVGALQAACAAATAGHLAVCESWLGKAQAMLDAAKKSTAQAIEKMGGQG